MGQIRITYVLGIRVRCSPIQSIGLSSQSELRFEPGPFSKLLRHRDAVDDMRLQTPGLHLIHQKRRKSFKLVNKSSQFY